MLNALRFTRVATAKPALALLEANVALIRLVNKPDVSAKNANAPLIQNVAKLELVLSLAANKLLLINSIV
jgi:hypothetical protein